MFIIEVILGACHRGMQGNGHFRKCVIVSFWEELVLLTLRLSSCTIDFLARQLLAFSRIWVMGGVSETV